MLTASQLFALANGIAAASGPFRCWFCGGAAAQKCADAATVVKDSFTARDIASRGSKVCDGCMAAMQEKATVVLFNGEKRENQKIRSYSWVITRHKAEAYPKSYLPALADRLLNPPEPPFAIVISKSGQKHLIYLAPVNLDKTNPGVVLETNIVYYKPEELRKRLALCVLITAALGKKALDGPLTISQAIKMKNMHIKQVEEIVQEWNQVWDEPLSWLAAAVCPKKGDMS